MAGLQSGNYESPYLCTKCRQPLYVQMKSQREACLESACANWPAGYASVADADEAHSPGIHEELEEQRSQILEMIRRCDLASVRRFAHELRGKLARSLLETSAMRISDWHDISELLVLTQTEPSKRLHTAGVGGGEATFTAILGETSAWAEQMRFLEDLQTGRYRILKRPDGNLDYSDGWSLKYAAEVGKDEGAFGLAHGLDQADNGPLFEYQRIETAATPSPAPTTADLGELLETLWPLTLHLRYALHTHWRTTRLYKYQPQLVDLSVIAGYWIQCQGSGTNRIPAEKEQSELRSIDLHLRTHSNETVTAADFVRRYIDCEEQAPIIVRTPEGWLLDHATLFLFMVYLQGEPGLVDKNVPHLSEPLLQRMRERAGQEFEIWLRSELQSKGFSGPDQPVTVRLQYDILMISETEKIVVLADAKYRDINPSSLTGENLVSQELLGDQGILAEAERQEDRLSHFLENRDAFSSFLTPQRPWSSYQVRSYLVTKSVPLISKYGETEILKASEFLASLP